MTLAIMIHQYNKGLLSSNCIEFHKNGCYIFSKVHFRNHIIGADYLFVNFRTGMCHNNNHEDNIDFTEDNVLLWWKGVAQNCQTSKISF